MLKKIELLLQELFSVCLFPSTSPSSGGQWLKKIHGHSQKKPLKNPFHLNIDQEQGRYAHFKTKNWTLKAIQPNLLDFGSSSKNRVHYFLQKIILQTGKALQGYTETVKNKFQGQIFVEK